jgi:hypothetical protein
LPDKVEAEVEAYMGNVECNAGADVEALIAEE